MSLATSASPTDLGNNVYRFYLNGKLNVGAVTLAIAADAIADSTGAQNRALTQRFTVTGTIGSITGPQDGGAIGLASQNSRGFLDVTFGFLEGQTPDLASIYDLEPEFAINPATGGASYSIALDATQAPVLVAHVDGSTTWTFRYWTTGSYTSGAVTVSLIAGAIRFTNGALSTATDTLTIAAPASANVGYLDVNYQPVSGFELDVATIVDPAAEFTLGGAGAGVTQSSSYAPLRLTNSNTFRYFLQDDFVAGEVTVDFIANSVESVQHADGLPDTRIGNAAKQQKFVVQVLSASLENPRNGDTLDVDALNQRGYIVVTFQVPAYAESIDVATVTDLDPELKITLDTGASLALDDSQAPVLKSQNATSYTFRYWTIGTFDSTKVHVAFIGASFDYLDTSGRRIPNFAEQSVVVQQDAAGLYVLLDFGESLTLDASSVDVADVAVHTAGVTLSAGSQRGPPDLFRFNVAGAAVHAGDEISLGFQNGGWSYGAHASVMANAPQASEVTSDNFTYIDVRYGTVGGIGLDVSKLDGNEFSISGSGLGSAALQATAPTRVADGVFRYYFSRGFVAGPVVIEFHGAAWADEQGNPGSDSTESLQLVETVKQPSAQGGHAVGKIFFIEISGGIKLQGLGFTDEPIIDIRGGVKLEVGDFVLDNGATIKRFSVDANGTIKIIKLGNIGSAAARFVLQTGDTVSGQPEFWGVVKVQANLDFLKNYGIFVEGEATLQINTTPTEKTEKLVLEGIPGDRVAENLDLSAKCRCPRAGI